MLEVILNKLMSLLLKIVPNIMLRRFFRIDYIKQDFEVDLRSINPVNLHLNSPIPSFSIWLRFTNKSSIPVLVDRALFNVWFGQPTISGALLERYEVRPKETLKDICFECKLSEVQKQVINNMVTNRNYAPSQIYIYIDVYCESKLGRFQIKIRKDYPFNSIQF